MRHLDHRRILNVPRWLLPVVMMAVVAACGEASSAGKSDPTPARLVGAWRSRIQFSNGPRQFEARYEF